MGYANCGICGKPFIVKSKTRRGRPQKYCSDECRKKALKRQIKKYQECHRVMEPRPTTFVCANCGKIVTSSGKHENGKIDRRERFCSEKCMGAYWKSHYMTTTNEDELNIDISPLDVLAAPIELNKPKEVVKMDGEGNIVETFESVREAARKSGMSKIGILNSCKDAYNKPLSREGFTFVWNTAAEIRKRRARLGVGGKGRER